MFQIVDRRGNKVNRCTYEFMKRKDMSRKMKDGKHGEIAKLILLYTECPEVLKRSNSEISLFVHVTSPLHESRLLWIHDPHRSQPSRVPASHPPASQKNNPVPRINNSVPRTNSTAPRSEQKVLKDSEIAPRNNPIGQSSDVRMRAPLENISSSAWHNSAISSRANNCPPVPRNNVTDRQTSSQEAVQPPPKRKRNRVQRRERRARERAEIEEAFIHDAQWAPQSSGAPSSTIVPDRLTPLGLLHSDPISAMRPAVYPPVTLEGRPSANENSSFQFDQELGESAGLLPGLYKPAVPDPQHNTLTSSSRARSSEERPPSPTRTSRACSSGSRPRTGIVYPLQPRQSRPDVCITVEVSLPEPAALHRQEPRPTCEAPTSLSRSHRRLGRKRRRNRSSAIYRPPNAHLHGGAGVIYKQSMTGINKKINVTGIDKVKSK